MNKEHSNTEAVIEPSALTNSTDSSQVNIVSEADTDIADDAPSQSGSDPNQILANVVNPATSLSVRDVLTAVKNGQTGLAMLLSQHIYRNRFASEGCGSKAEFFKNEGGLWVKDERSEHRDADVELANILKCTRYNLWKNSTYFEDDINKVSSAINKVQNCTTFSSIISRATQGSHGCCVPAERWDDDIYTLTTQEGIIDLKTGHVRELTPSDYRRKCASVSLLPPEYASEPTLWLSTLRESFKVIGMPELPDDSELKKANLDLAKLRESEAEWSFSLDDEPSPKLRAQIEKVSRLQQEYDAAMEACRDEYERWESGAYATEAIDFLQLFLGYCLRGDNRDQKFMIFVGDKGRNGKGVITHVLRDILGDYLSEVRSEIFMKGRQKDSGSATPEIMALQGKRIVIGSENDRGDALNASFIKRVTGGDELSGRMLYGNEQSFRPSFVPILLTNHFPHVDTEDQALLTRCLCLKFERTFVENPDPANVFEGQIDTQLEEKLRAEYPAILAWIVQGALRYEQEGRFTVPEFIKLSGNTYRESKDILGQFLEECCTTVPNPNKYDGTVEETASDMYAAYAQWSEENGLKANGRPMFKERMASKGYRQIKCSSNYYQGVMLNALGDSLKRAWLDRKRPN